jgi:YfiH family protein
MLTRLAEYIRRAHWLEATHRIPAWESLGISHGFEGRGFELPVEGRSLRQIHSAKIHEVSSNSRDLEGDGLMATQQKTLIAVKTADCVPILVHHPQGVMALHAGWKGLAQDILGLAIHDMRKRGWDLRAASFAIGPCISLDSFEVGPDVIEALRAGPFQMREAEFAFASSKGRLDRWHLDLGVLALMELARFDLDPLQIHIIRTCTRKDEGRWHSFRREGSQAGRNWSWIVAPA